MSTTPPATTTTLDEPTSRFLLLGALPGPRETAAVEAVAPTYKLGPPEWARLWAQHEVELRAFAATCGFKPIGSTKKWFAESIVEREDRRGQ